MAEDAPFTPGGKRKRRLKKRFILEEDDNDDGEIGAKKNDAMGDIEDDGHDDDGGETSADETPAKRRRRSLRQLTPVATRHSDIVRQAKRERRRSRRQLGSQAMVADSGLDTSESEDDDAAAYTDCDEEAEAKADDDFIAEDDDVLDGVVADSQESESSQPRDKESIVNGAYSRADERPEGFRQRDERLFGVWLKYLAYCLLEPTVDWVENSSDIQRQKEFQEAVSHVRFMEVKVDSIMNSFAWDANITAIMKECPLLTTKYAYDDDEEEEDCQVCRRADHKVSYELTFAGNCYWFDQLVQKHVLADVVMEREPSHHVYNAGNVCFSRVSVCHGLLHFKLAMLLSLQARLDEIRADKEYVEGALDTAAMVKKLVIPFFTKQRYNDWRSLDKTVERFRKSSDTRDLGDRYVPRTITAEAIELMPKIFGYNDEDADGNPDANVLMSDDEDERERDGEGDANDLKLDDEVECKHDDEAKGKGQDDEADDSSTQGEEADGRVVVDLSEDANGAQSRSDSSVVREGDVVIVAEVHSEPSRVVFSAKSMSDAGPAVVEVDGGDRNRRGSAQNDQSNHPPAQRKDAEVGDGSAASSLNEAEVGNGSAVSSMKEAETGDGNVASSSSGKRSRSPENSDTQPAKKKQRSLTRSDTDPDLAARVAARSNDENREANTTPASEEEEEDEDALMLVNTQSSQLSSHYFNSQDASSLSSTPPPVEASSSPLHAAISQTPRAVPNDAEVNGSQSHPQPQEPHVAGVAGPSPSPRANGELSESQSGFELDTYSQDSEYLPPSRSRSLSESPERELQSTPPSPPRKSPRKSPRKVKATPAKRRRSPRLSSVRRPVREKAVISASGGPSRSKRASLNPRDVDAHPAASSSSAPRARKSSPVTKSRGVRRAVSKSPFSRKRSLFRSERKPQTAPSGSRPTQTPFSSSSSSSSSHGTDIPPLPRRDGDDSRSPSPLQRGLALANSANASRPTKANRSANASRSASPSRRGDNDGDADDGGDESESSQHSQATLDARADLRRILDSPAQRDRFLAELGAHLSVANVVQLLGGDGFSARDRRDVIKELVDHAQL